MNITFESFEDYETGEVEAVLYLEDYRTRFPIFKTTFPYNGKWIKEEALQVFSEKMLELTKS